jgi:hypothetical protein
MIRHTGRLVAIANKATGPASPRRRRHRDAALNSPRSARPTLLTVHRAPILVEINIYPRRREPGVSRRDGQPDPVRGFGERRFGPATAVRWMICALRSQPTDRRRRRPRQARRRDERLERQTVGPDDVFIRYGLADLGHSSSPRPRRRTSRPHARRAHAVAVYLVSGTSGPGRRPRSHATAPRDGRLAHRQRPPAAARRSPSSRTRTLEVAFAPAAPGDRAAALAVAAPGADFVYPAGPSGTGHQQAAPISPRRSRRYPARAHAAGEAEQVD